MAKLAGLLVEARPQQGWAVLGIGLNAAVALASLPPELHETAATLGLHRERARAAARRAARGALAAARRAARVRRSPPGAQRDALRGRRCVGPPRCGRSAGGSGVAQGIDGDGRLVVALEGGGRTALGSGEVHLRPVR